MNSYAALLLLLAACFCIAGTSPPPVGCRPGSRKVEGTRNCVCSRLAVWECHNIGHHQHHKRDVDSQRPIEKQCEPGKSWYNGCNHCVCTPTGLAICTLRHCQFEGERKGQLRTKREAEVDKLKCEPGAVWMDDCNRCFCTEDGLAACTKKKCIKVPRNERSVPSGEKLHGLYCKPGESWTEGCNTCHCTEAAARRCTTRHCPIDKAIGHKHKRSTGGPIEKQCEPGKSWYDGCNNCVCTPTGLAVCTLRYCQFEGESKGKLRTKREVEGGTKRCVPGTTWIASHMECFCTEDAATICSLLHKPPLAFSKPPMAKRSVIGADQECEPGKTWYEDCNRCSCDERGTAYCTDMVCNQPELTRHNRETHGKCTPGTTWHEDCNTCGCDNNGNVYCTLMLCVPGMNPKAKRAAEGVNSCTPGSTWMDDCNRCICTNDGFTACTDMACPPKHEVTKRSPKTEAEDRCNPGDRWTDDCNECKCSDTGYPLCTRMSCHPKAVVLKPKRSVSVPPGGRKCTPGQRWTDECENRCWCSSTGAAVCTEMGCIRPKRSVQGCNPGDSWKEDCNFCRCAAKGVPICTRKMCSTLRRKRTVDNHGDQISCTPGETFMIECNTCRCGPDGKTAGCTYMACPPGLKPKFP